MTVPNRTIPTSGGWPTALICLATGSFSLALFTQAVLENPSTAADFFSTPLWGWLVTSFGGKFRTSPASMDVRVPFSPIVAASVVLTLLTWIAGAMLISARTGGRLPRALVVWSRSWAWWLLPGTWFFFYLVSYIVAWTGLQRLLDATPAFAVTAALAGWLATLWTQCAPVREPSRIPNADHRSDAAMMAAVGIGICVYVVCFTAMNWQLYWGLLLPHGDSAMYEEHLWNLTHGKGFRSYLDQGLFLGEHTQVVHVLLLPLYVVWPSHLLLELCETAALASAALPVYWMARRHSGSAECGVVLAGAYLLYVPMHFLDIAIDLKTFRPTCFGLAALMFAMDQLERRRYRTMALLMLIALSAKEDYAAIIAPLGLWLAYRGSDRRERWIGGGLSAGTVVYLVLVITVLIPAFRSGDDVHYARYFGELGSSPGDIVRSLLTQPALVLSKLFSLRSIVYALVLLVPLGMLPLLSPGRLSVALPLFGVLCLLELSADPGARGQMLVPLHHFHAPLIPILFWAAAGGLAALSASAGPRWLILRHVSSPFACRFALLSALATGAVFGYSPLSIGFWDPGSTGYWRSRYVPGRRAEMFARIETLIPKDARVASTDFVHPRFTHHERSYDYSNYPRAVNDGKPGAPPDTDYIVIDTRHYYSTITKPEQIPEYREHPERWELLPDTTEGYFIVLKRRWNDESE